MAGSGREAGMRTILIDPRTDEGIAAGASFETGPARAAGRTPIVRGAAALRPRVSALGLAFGYRSSGLIWKRASHRARDAARTNRRDRRCGNYSSHTATPDGKDHLARCEDVSLNGKDPFPGYERALIAEAWIDVWTFAGG